MEKSTGRQKKLPVSYEQAHSLYSLCCALISKNAHIKHKNTEHTQRKSKERRELKKKQHRVLSMNALK